MSPVFIARRLVGRRSTGYLHRVIVNGCRRQEPLARAFSTATTCEEAPVADSQQTANELRTVSPRVPLAVCAFSMIAYVTLRSTCDDARKHASSSSRANYKKHTLPSDDEQYNIFGRTGSLLFSSINIEDSIIVEEVEEELLMEDTNMEAQTLWAQSYSLCEFESDVLTASQVHEMLGHAAKDFADLHQRLRLQEQALEIREGTIELGSATSLLTGVGGGAGLHPHPHLHAAVDPTCEGTTKITSGGAIAWEIKPATDSEVLGKALNLFGKKGSPAKEAGGGPQSLLGGDGTQTFGGEPSPLATPGLQVVPGGGVVGAAMKGLTQTPELSFGVGGAGVGTSSSSAVVPAGVAADHLQAAATSIARKTTSGTVTAGGGTGIIPKPVESEAAKAAKAAKAKASWRKLPKQRKAWADMRTDDETTEEDTRGPSCLGGGDTAAATSAAAAGSAAASSCSSRGQQLNEVVEKLLHSHMRREHKLKSGSSWEHKKPVLRDKQTSTVLTEEDIERKQQRAAELREKQREELAAAGRATDEKVEKARQRREEHARKLHADLRKKMEKAKVQYQESLQEVLLKARTMNQRVSGEGKKSLMALEGGAGDQGNKFQEDEDMKEGAQIRDRRESLEQHVREKLLASATRIAKASDRRRTDLSEKQRLLLDQLYEKERQAAVNREI
eukprot:g18721.t1